MTTRFTTPALSPMVPGTAARPRVMLRALTMLLRRVTRTSESRRVPTGLDDRLRTDIGMTREAALNEAARAPWDVSWLPPRGPRLPRGNMPHPTPGRRIARASVAAQGWLAAAWQRHRSRQHIANLDAATLKDIGVTYAEAEHEANRPFWR